MSVNHIEALMQLPLFHKINISEMRELDKLLCTQFAAAREHLIQLGQPNDRIYVVVEGTVRIYIRRERGPMVSLGILGPGETLGEISALDESPATASAQTMESCQLLVIQRDRFANALSRIPQLALNLIHIQNRRMRLLTAHAESMASLYTEGRLARQLLLFAKDHGVKEAGSPIGGTSIRINLHLTQADLAALCGSSAKQINRAMASYQDQKIVAVAPGYRISILSLEELQLRCGAGKSDF